MKWIRERDELIAQTMAFVQSISGQQPTTRPAVPSAEAPQGAPMPEPVRIALPAADIRTEIQQRVANFRKHQERFEREREEFCRSTLAKARGASSDLPPRRSEPFSVN